MNKETPQACASCIKHQELLGMEGLATFSRELTYNGCPQKLDLKDCTTFAGEVARYAQAKFGHLIEGEKLIRELRESGIGDNAEPYPNPNNENLCDKCYYTRGQCPVRLEDITLSAPNPDAPIIKCKMFDVVSATLEHPAGKRLKELSDQALERNAKDGDGDPDHEHDCATCRAYDHCFLPFKEERAPKSADHDCSACGSYSECTLLFKDKDCDEEDCDICEGKCDNGEDPDMEEQPQFEVTPGYIAPDFAADTDYMKLKTLFGEFGVNFIEDCDADKEPVICIQMKTDDSLTAGLVDLYTYYTFSNEGKFKLIGINA